MLFTCLRTVVLSIFVVSSPFTDTPKIVGQVPLAVLVKVIDAIFLCKNKKNRKISS